MGFIPMKQLLTLNVARYFGAIRFQSGATFSFYGYVVTARVAGAALTVEQFAFLGFQLLGVEAFGEAEFWLALIKLLGLVTYFIFSIM
jgi:amino acid permease